MGLEASESLGVHDAEGEGPRAAERALKAVRRRFGSRCIAWRGSDAQGLGVEGSLRAVEMGVERVHGSFAGVGGLTPIDQVLVNLDLMYPSEAPPELSYLTEHMAKLRAAGLQLSANYPVFGQDAFRTSTGVHAAAIVKALDLGRPELADQVYSGVAASRFGKDQGVELGPMSGLAAVRFWFSKLGRKFEEKKGRALLEKVKAQPSVLERKHIEALLGEVEQEMGDA